MLSTGKFYFIENNISFSGSKFLVCKLEVEGSKIDNAGYKKLMYIKSPNKIGF